jgi:hypothetical protein
MNFILILNQQLTLIKLSLKICAVLSPLATNAIEGTSLCTDDSLRISAFAAVDVKLVFFDNNSILVPLPKVIDVL